MDTREVAKAFTAMLREGKDASEALWHENVSSIEAMGGSLAVRGKEAVTAKGAAWYATHEVLCFAVEGPSVNDDQRARYTEIDIAVGADGQRSQMKQVGLYTVRHGKVVAERFFC